MIPFLLFIRHKSYVLNILVTLSGQTEIKSGLDMARSEKSIVKLSENHSFHEEQIM